MGRDAGAGRPVPTPSQPGDRDGDCRSGPRCALAGSVAIMADRVRCGRALETARSRRPGQRPPGRPRPPRGAHRPLDRGVARPLARLPRPRARDGHGHPVRPCPDRVPRGGGVQDRAGRADRRHDRRRPLPRRARARASTTSASRSRTSPRRSCTSRSTGSSSSTRPRARGAEGPVAFLHPRSCHGVLVELIEAPGGPSWASLGY